MIADGATDRRTSSRAAAALLALALALPAPTLAADAKARPYRGTRHGSRDVGVLRVPGYGRGDCVHCHGGRRDAAERAAKGGRGHAGLFAGEGNDLCLECHRGATGKYLGRAQFGASIHGTSPLAVWPGPVPPARPPSDAGRCVNCHDPHGVTGGAGLVPALLRKRRASLCLGCHSGNPGPDVGSAFASTYRHPLVDAAPPATPAAAPGVDASTCGGCHNVHAAGSERSGGDAAPALQGVPRVRVSNGRAGSAPLIEPVPVRDLQPPREHEICFKCHASSAPTPARGSDVAAELNPANASFHPVEERSRTSRLEPRSFVFGWRNRRTVTCSDCHSPDDAVGRGPHGSRWPHILKKRHLPPTSSEPPLESDLCLECHEWATYADPLGGEGGAFSRFPAHRLHAAQGTPCSGCHDAHGSAALPALLVLRRPGLAAYAQDVTRGSCTTTCHRTSSPTATYLVAYPR